MGPSYINFYLANGGCVVPLYNDPAAVAVGIPAVARIRPFEEYRSFTLGIGNYAPTMAMTYMLGMNSKAVFPIMAASASLILPAAALRFYKSGRFDKRVATGLAMLDEVGLSAAGGIQGVLVAAYLVKELPLTMVKWVVVVVLLYTAATLFRSSQAPVEKTA